MTAISVSLPESLKLFVEEQIAKGAYSSESEYLQALIRDAQVRHARRDLEGKLLDGLGTPRSPMTAEDWADLRRGVIDRSPELQRP